MTITASQVKELRDLTGAGMMECKKALTETGGDLEKAVDFLRSRGAAKAAKRAEKTANEGVVGSYVHHGGRIAAMVVLNCETDFVANTEDFQSLARDLAIHVAAAAPVAVREDDVDPELVNRERAVYLEQVKEEGKPEAIWEKIVDGKLRKFFSERVLMKQAYVKDPDQSIEELITAVSAKTGEKVEIARMARFSVTD